MPISFFPRQNPGNLNFFATKMLVTLLLSLSFFNFSLPSRYLRPDSNRHAGKAFVCVFCSSVLDCARLGVSTPGTSLPSIPLCGRRSCLWLTVPAVGHVADFHRLAIARAGLTHTERAVRQDSPSLCISIMLSSPRAVQTQLPNS